LSFQPPKPPSAPLTSNCRDLGVTNATSTAGRHYRRISSIISTLVLLGANRPRPSWIRPRSRSAAKRAQYSYLLYITKAKTTAKAKTIHKNHKVTIYSSFVKRIVGKGSCQKSNRPAPGVPKNGIIPMQDSVRQARPGSPKRFWHGVRVLRSAIKDVETIGISNTLTQFRASGEVTLSTWKERQRGAGRTIRVTLASHRDAHCFR
jgi:hypothetical protein